MRYFTLHYTRLHYTRLHYSTLHYGTLHYIHYTTPQLQLQLHYTGYTTHNYNFTTLQLQLQLHYATLHPAVVATTIATTPKTQLQPPFGPSVDSLCHPCITTTHFSYSVLSLKLPPPPCAVLLNIIQICLKFVSSPPGSGRDAAAWLVRKSRKGAGAKELLRWPWFPHGNPDGGGVKEKKNMKINTEYILKDAFLVVFGVACRATSTNTQWWACKATKKDNRYLSRRMIDWSQTIKIPKQQRKIKYLSWPVSLYVCEKESVCPNLLCMSKSTDLYVYRQGTQPCNNVKRWTSCTQYSVMICKCSFQRFFLDFSQGSRLNYPHSANFRALILPAVGASGIGHGVSNRQVIVIHLTSKTQIAET